MEYEQPKPKEAAKSSETKEEKRYKAISEQVIDEFKVGEDYILPWREKKRTYLKLYINQRKNPTKVGDTLMFATHQTILAALYKDRLDAEWIQREEENEERTDAINALGITVGYRVTVCSNLAFHGNYTPLLRKHTKNFDLHSALSVGIDSVQRNFEPMVKAVELWRGHQLTDVTAKQVIYEAYVEGHLDAAKHLARPTHDAYFSPPHEEFAPRTMWSLSNAFTHAFKGLDPIPQQKAAASLGEFLQRYN